MTRFRGTIIHSAMLMTWLFIADAAALQSESSHVNDPLPKLGQAVRDENLSLSEITQIALQHSPERTRLEAMNERSRALFKRAENLLGSQPSLNLAGRSDQWQSDEGVREYQLGVDLPMWRLGERRAGRELAETTAEWVSAEWNDIRLEMSGTLRELIWDYAQAENALDSAASALEMARKTESDMARRAKLGELSRSDLLLAQQQTLQREQESISAIAEQEHVLMRYETITGTRRLPHQWREQKTSIDEITDAHAGLYTLLKAVERARSEIALLRKKRGDPVTLGLTGYHTRDDVGSDFNDSLELTVGIPFGPKSYREVALAELQQNAADAEARLIKRRRELKADLHDAEHELHLIEGALIIAEKSRLLAEEQLRMAQTAFKVGESNLFVLLLVQNKTVQARRNYRESRIVRQRSIADYNQAAGVIL